MDKGAYDAGLGSCKHRPERSPKKECQSWGPEVESPPLGPQLHAWHTVDSHSFFLPPSLLLPLSLSLSFFFIFKSFIEVELICKVVVISATQQSHPVTYAHTSTSVQMLFPRRVLGRVLYAVQQVPIGQSFHIPQCTYASPASSVHPSPIPTDHLSVPPRGSICSI